MSLFAGFEFSSREMSGVRRMGDFLMRVLDNCLDFN